MTVKNYFEINGTAFTLVRGVESVFNRDVSLTTLIKNGWNNNKVFPFFNGFSGISFKGTIIVRHQEKVGVISKQSILDNICRGADSVSIVSYSSVMPNGKYIVVKAKKTGENDTYVEYELEFVEDNYYSDNGSVDYDRVNEYWNKRLERKETVIAEKVQEDVPKEIINPNELLLSDCPTPISYNTSVTECTRLIQQALQTHGFYLMFENRRLIVDGIYDRYTAIAISQFQSKNGLVVNGVFDHETKSKLVER